jgi:NAD(P)-dependent dehydrogenase (short-subunit alcohol dehydrogenase family)
MLENGLFSLAGEVAVVIGGGGVLAGAMAEGLSAAGAAVVIAGRTQEHADERARSITDAGGQAIGIQCDVTRKADLEAVLEKGIQRFGKVDILVNAAGVNSATPFFEITEEEWHRILDIDLTGVFLACQVFGKAMVDAGNGGAIINISSASSGPPLSRVFTYGVAKGGVNQITKFLARELAPNNIRVNAILPGFFPAEQNRKVLTPERIASILGHTPMKRFGEAEELVGTTIYLASRRASSFVTGAIVPVDGGFMSMTI